MSGVFYTYIWLREDGSPYYVGKGRLRRALRTGCPPLDRVVLQDWPCENDAFDAEKLLISYYGRIDLGTGCLRNRTDGGEGTSGRSGWKMSTEARDKMRRAKLGTKRVFSEAHKAHLSAANKGQKPHPNTIASRKGARASAQTIEKLKKANFGKRYSAATKELHAAAWRGDRNPKRRKK